MCNTVSSYVTPFFSLFLGLTLLQIYSPSEKWLVRNTTGSSGASDFIKVLSRLLLKPVPRGTPVGQDQVDPENRAEVENGTRVATFTKYNLANGTYMGTSPNHSPVSRADNRKPGPSNLGQGPSSLTPLIPHTTSTGALLVFVDFKRPVRFDNSHFCQALTDSRYLEKQTA